jgi:hypothetical protein
MNLGEHTTVTCSECGRRDLYGTKTLKGRWSILKHNRPGGGRCSGHLTVNHEPTRKETP